MTSISILKPAKLFHVVQNKYAHLMEMVLEARVELARSQLIKQNEIRVKLLPFVYFVTPLTNIILSYLEDDSNLNTRYVRWYCPIKVQQEYVRDFLQTCELKPDNTSLEMDLELRCHVTAKMVEFLFTWFTLGIEDTSHPRTNVELQYYPMWLINFNCGSHWVIYADGFFYHSNWTKEHRLRRWDQCITPPLTIHKAQIVGEAMGLGKADEMDVRFCSLPIISTEEMRRRLTNLSSLEPDLVFLTR